MLNAERFFDQKLWEKSSFYIPSNTVDIKKLSGNSAFNIANIALLCCWKNPFLMFSLASLILTSCKFIKNNSKQFKRNIKTRDVEAVEAVLFLWK